MASKQLRLGRHNLPLQDPRGMATTRRRVRAEKTTEIPPYSMIEVSACLDQPIEEDKTWLLEENSDNHAPTPVAQALVQPRNDSVPVRLLNTRGEPLVVYAGMELATLEEAEVPVESVSTISTESSVMVGKEKVGNFVGSNEQIKLRPLR